MDSLIYAVARALVYGSDKYRIRDDAYDAEVWTPETLAERTREMVGRLDLDLEPLARANPKDKFRLEACNRLHSASKSVDVCAASYISASDRWGRDRTHLIVWENKYLRPLSDWIWDDLTNKK